MLTHNIHNTIVLTFVNIHKIHIITHRRRLTNTCTHAYSETYARTLIHTYTNMHTHPYRLRPTLKYALTLLTSTHTKIERENSLFKAYAYTSTYTHTHHTHTHTHTTHTCTLTYIHPQIRTLLHAN